MFVAHWRYFTHVIRHKWYVLIACWRFRVPLLQAMLHDASKFRPREWFAYTEYFSIQNQTSVGVPLTERRSYAGRRLADVQPDMNRAWLHHLHANPHHWQHWIVQENADSFKALPMPERYYKEMIADWVGAGRAQGKRDIAAWYTARKHQLLLHPDTRMRVEAILGRPTR
jgi:hypothetical protein